GPGAPTGDVTLFVDLSASTAAQTVARLTFSGSLTEFGSLIDGTYTLTVLGSQVTGNGQPLDGDGNGTPGGDFTFHLFRLFGDGDGNGGVDFSDLARFRLALGSPTGYNPAFDFDGNGSVDFSDLAQFRLRLGAFLP